MDNNEKDITLPSDDFMYKKKSSFEFCPSCKGKNTTWIFFINLQTNIRGDTLSRCKDCGYEDIKGNFAIVNKINEIIDNFT